ncbi:MAG: hypothetical protein NTV01_06680 [Bacteroidia bacterium]|nr:hypothetical protein [Bacteroidia bacterium]
MKIMKPQLSIGCNKLIMVPAFLVLIIAGCEYIHPNKPPYAEKILPVESAFFIGQTILFQVNAYDEDGTIDGVVFTPPNSSPFIDKTAPYEYSWPTTGMTVGVYKVEIKAVDNKNEPYIIEVPITLHGISAGKDTTFTDSTKTYVLDARLPENAQGTWTIISGTGGHIDETEIHNRNATLYGISCETFTLRWTVSLGTIEIYDDVTITFFHQPSQANAGPDQSYTDARISTKLQANDPIDGVGLWTIFSGGDGSFSNQVKPDATFTGLPSTTYKLIWNITTVCATSADTVEITFSHGAINANAGPDQFYTDSRTTATLAAESPTTGTWSIISGTGGAISDIHDPKATLTGISCQTYILRWPVSSGAPQDYDEVTIVFSYQPSKANAGVDQSINDGRTSTVLQANTPANGTGHWTIIAGLNGQFTNVSDPQAVFTGQPCQSYTLRWTIATPCSSNSDDMTIALNHDPSAASAGPDQVFNDGRNRATLAGNIPAVGTGIWTIISGTSGEFADASDPKSVFTGLICQDYILRWTISTACGSKYDEVQITFGYLASEADAGADQHLTDGSNFTQLRATPCQDSRRFCNNRYAGKYTRSWDYRNLVNLNGIGR